MRAFSGSRGLRFIFRVCIAMILTFKCCLGQATTPETSVSPSGTGGKKENGVDAGSPDAVLKEQAPKFSYAVWNNEGKICILSSFTATFTITYPSDGGDQMVSVNLPEDAPTNGRCGNYKKNIEPSMELFWPGFRLTMNFTTTKPKDKPVPESWELNVMNLTYNTQSSLFDGAIDVGKKVAFTQEEYPLFHTPFGKSYFCPSPDVIPLYNDKLDRIVLARLQDVKIQVWDVQGKFSPGQRCSLVRIGGIPEPFAQDQTVPIAVGSTLAVMSVLVILGYALWRNMAVRKSDYGYME